MNRPHTNWLCSCGAKLHYRSRHITRVGILARYYVCSNSTCGLVWESEEHLVSYKHRGEKEKKGHA